MNDKNVPQGLKPSSGWCDTARLKPCPSSREFFPASMGLGEQEWKPQISSLRSGPMARRDSRDDNAVAGRGSVFPGKVRGTADPSTARRDRSASLGVCDFFIFRCSLRPESSQEHLPTSIAGVLRLRAIKRSVCDRSAKRFAQDDGFVGGLKCSWLDMQKTRKDRKSHRLSG
jgi:hypothetical protein